MNNKHACMVLALMALWGPAQAQEWPSKPINMVVPFPAGGATDTVARAMALKMGQTLGQSIVVSNRPGATGSIGAAQIARAAPDGYTILFSSLATYVIAPHLMNNLAYDANTSFDYLSMPVQAPNVLVAAPTQTAQTVAEVVELLKAKPGEVTFASSGSGASDHLSAEIFWQQTDTNGLHVPYRGGAPAINDLLAGQVDFSFQNVNAVLPYIRAGRLKPIAVTGAARSPVLPDVPTLDEAGVTGAQVYSWQGLAAPQGLPDSVKARLAQAAIDAITSDEVSAPFQQQGLEIVASTPEAFTALQAKEFARWGELIQQRGITID